MSITITLRFEDLQSAILVLEPSTYGGCPEKYHAILNVSRTGRVALI
jgi:hypothetical protein